MHCPYHGDGTRSAGLNIETGMFRCQACGEVKTVEQLIRDKEEWDMPMTSTNRVNGTARPKEEITEAVLDGWHSALLSNSKRLNALMRRRGLTIETIRNYELGWDQKNEAYTIPIRDSAGSILNVRRYQIDVPEDRRKIWSVDGMGTPVLYPVDQLDNSSIVVCEGEMDALLTIQNGIPAITRTGAADVWDSKWSHAFKDKNVYVCHDMDTKGQHANTRISSALQRYAKKITVIHLPYDVTEKHGKDLTDFWMEGADRADFIDLIKAAEPIVDRTEDGLDPEDPTQPVAIPINVMSSFDASLVERPLSMNVTVVGKKNPSYLVPKIMGFTCENVGGSPKCKVCSFEERGVGSQELEIDGESPLILELINVTKERMIELLKKEAGVVVKCPFPKHTIVEQRTVEEVYVRPSIEEGHTSIKQDFTHRQVISAASHDLVANESVILTGTIRPQPKTQLNEFQAWKVERPESGLDHFVVTPDVWEEMHEFQTDDPMDMLKKIADDQAKNYTRIFGRETFHIFADLVIHSLIELPFPGYKDEKGWLDAIAVGDTRTGKSAAAEALLTLYAAGDMVSCEAASFAGVVGGLDRIGDNKWVIKWGSIPVNDRRVVVLDEVSGLTVEQISQMSSMRSSGVAEIVKVHAEKAKARTRLLWLGNPRNESMDTMAYGIDALRKLIGNQEDLARFDMAMGVFSSDVSGDVINLHRPISKEKLFSEEAYRGLLRWSWTRTGKDVRWGRGVDKLVLDRAKQMGARYIEQPPLIQVANARMKIARVAGAIAARTFSTSNGKAIVLLPSHVEAAVAFLDLVYNHVRFGYGVVSKQKIADVNATIAAIPRIMEFMAQRPNLTRFFLTSPTFSKFQMQSLLNVSDEEASITINGLWDLKAVEMYGNQIRVVPAVLDQLRGGIIGDA